MRWVNWERTCVKLPEWHTARHHLVRDPSAFRKADARQEAADPAEALRHVARHARASRAQSIVDGAKPLAQLSDPHARAMSA